MKNETEQKESNSEGETTPLDDDKKGEEDKNKLTQQNNTEPKSIIKQYMAPWSNDIIMTLKQTVLGDVINREIVEIKTQGNKHKPIIIHSSIYELLKTGYIKQRTEKWLQSRQSMITASKVHPITQDNNLKTKQTMFKMEVGIVPKFKGNMYTEHGMMYEPIAIHRYQMFTHKLGIKFGLIIHKDYKFIGGSPDLITVDGILVEIKCPFRRNLKRIENLKRYIIPPQYMSQVQLLLEVTELEVAHYVEYYLPDEYNKEELYIVEIKRDRTWFKRILPKLTEWYNHLIEFYIKKKKFLSLFVAHLLKYKLKKNEHDLLLSYYNVIKYRLLMGKTNPSNKTTNAIPTFKKRKYVYKPTTASSCTDWRKESERKQNNMSHHSFENDSHWSYNR